MALTREKIDFGKIRLLFPKARAGEHKYMKHCINKRVRMAAKKIDLDDDKNIPLKKPYRGWEY